MFIPYSWVTRLNWFLHFLAGDNTPRLHGRGTRMCLYLRLSPLLAVIAVTAVLSFPAPAPCHPLCALRLLILESLISRYHSWSLEILCSSVLYQTTNGSPERLSDLPKNTVWVGARLGLEPRHWPDRFGQCSPRLQPQADHPQGASKSDE